MPVFLRRRWLCLPLLAVGACAFDTGALKPVDGGSAPESSIATDGQKSDAWADSAQEDAPAQLDQGASDLGAGDRSLDASCTPQCGGKLCGASDGCGGTCLAGSGCCTPQCDRAVCGGHDGCGGTCHGDNGDPCGAAAETWRCLWIDGYGTWGAQVCRGGQWLTYSLNPRSCAGCCGIFSPDCCPSAGCPD